MAAATTSHTKIRRSIQRSITIGSARRPLCQPLGHRLRENFSPIRPYSGIRSKTGCFEMANVNDVHREKTMSKTRLMLATLALGTAVAFAGPAFAQKMTVKLDGASEVPPNTSAGK